MPGTGKERLRIRIPAGDHAQAMLRAFLCQSPVFARSPEGRVSLPGKTKHRTLHFIPQVYLQTPANVV
jgi:hypothetical protein